MCATYRGWETGSKSLREIGEFFGGLDNAAVTQRIRRTKSTYNPIAARRLIITMFRFYPYFVPLLPTILSPCDRLEAHSKGRLSAKSSTK
jgi:hypothetical protein